MKRLDALVITATYNERDNIISLIDSILSLGMNFNILVIDDSSPDGTGELVENIAQKNKLVHVLHRPGKLGYGSAYIDGFRWAMEHEAEVILTMDADFSHNPNYLPDMYDALKRSDTVIGSRYIEGGRTVNWPLRRQILSSFANKYIRMITGMSISDSTSGFRGYNRAVLNNTPFESFSSKGYSFLVELIYNIFSRGFKIIEIPITFEERRLGKSKMSTRVIWESIWLPFQVRFKRMV